LRVWGFDFSFLISLIRTVDQIEILIIENFQKKSVYFLFDSGSLDSPGGPSSNRRYSITGVLPSDGNYVCGPGRPFRSQNTDCRPTHTPYSATIR